MDQIICQFAEKTAVHLLDKYRHMICRHADEYSSNVSMQSVSRWSSEGCCSTAEGASLARLFSPDDKTSREVEFDVMLTMLEWPDEESLTYVDNNEAFIHIPVSSQVLTRVEPFHIEGDEQRLSRQKDDGMYLRVSYFSFGSVRS